jgi:hypothetical protein
LVLFLSFSIGWTVFIPGPKKKKNLDSKKNKRKTKKNKRNENIGFLGDFMKEQF